MTDQQQDDIRRALKQALPPVRAELLRDLWPVMRQKLEAPLPRVAWYDWALVGLIGGAVTAVPDLILVLMYHL
jgi:hypothetical protein